MIMYGSHAMLAQKVGLGLVYYLICFTAEREAVIILVFFRVRLKGDGGHVIENKINSLPVNCVTKICAPQFIHCAHTYGDGVMY